jgi:UrcA family protein
MKTIVCAALVAASLLAPGAVLAETQTVSLQGLDLATPAGHAAAVERIRKAAFRLCREVPVEGVGQLADWLKYNDCARQAAEGAVAQLPAVGR